MMGDPRSFGADQEAFEQFLAERGAQAMPNPAIDLGEWIEDTRN